MRVRELLDVLETLQAIMKLDCEPSTKTAMVKELGGSIPPLQLCAACPNTWAFVTTALSNALVDLRSTPKKEEKESNDAQGEGAKGKPKPAPKGKRK